MNDSFERALRSVESSQRQLRSGFSVSMKPQKDERGAAPFKSFTQINIEVIIVNFYNLLHNKKEKMKV
jgi:hypothetical protein